jgi:transcriptional antiterminator RfaH
MSRWYLAFSKPKQEAQARQHLLNQGFETYLPMFKTLGASRTRPDDAGGVVRDPMFPRYVFFKPGHAGQSVSAARNTRGVSSLVAFGFVLATVPDDLVETIRSLELEREQADLAEITPFQPGTRVRLREKGLQCLEGLVVSVSSKRVTLLLEILGRQKELCVEHSQLVLA